MRMIRAFVTDLDTRPPLLTPGGARLAPGGAHLTPGGTRLAPDGAAWLPVALAQRRFRPGPFRPATARRWGCTGQGLSVLHETPTPVEYTRMLASSIPPSCSTRRAPTTANKRAPSATRSSDTGTRTPHPCLRSHETTRRPRPSWSTPDCRPTAPRPRGVHPPAGESHPRFMQHTPSATKATVHDPSATRSHRTSTRVSAWMSARASATNRARRVEDVLSARGLRFITDD